MRARGFRPASPGARSTQVRPFIYVSTELEDSSASVSIELEDSGIQGACSAPLFYIFLHPLCWRFLHFFYRYLLTICSVRLPTLRRAARHDATALPSRLTSLYINLSNRRNHTLQPIQKRQGDPGCLHLSNNPTNQPFYLPTPPFSSSLAPVILLISSFPCISLLRCLAVDPQIRVDTCSG